MFSRKSKSVLLIAFTTIAMVILSCAKCDNITCTGLSQNHREWLPYEGVDIIVFKNDKGGEMIFESRSLEFDETRTIHCGRGGALNSCDCYEATYVCPVNEGNYQASSNDHSRFVDLTGKQDIIYNRYSVWFSEKRNNIDSLPAISYTILDLNNFISIDDENGFVLDSGYVSVSEMTFNGKLYFDVVIHEIDTTIIPPNPKYRKYYVWKSYFTKKEGIIAFHDNKTNSLFYRK